MNTFLCEVSTVLVNARGILIVHKQEDKTYFKINNYVTAFLFVVFRIFYIPIMIYRMVQGFKYLPVSADYHNLFDRLRPTS